MTIPFSLADLPWLPPAPDDFRVRCKALDAGPSPRGTALRRLANAALSLNQLTRLSRSVDVARTAGDDLAPLRHVRLGLLSNATVDLLAPALTATALRYGLALEIVTTPFDQAMQQALDPNSEINRASPDVVFLALDHRAFGFDSSPLVQADVAAGRALERIQSMREGIQVGCGAPVVLQTLPNIPKPYFGSLDARLGSAIDHFNRGLFDVLGESADLLLDVAGMARTIGYERWHDPTQWHMAKLSFAQALVPYFADHVARLLAAARGLSRKCLVLDLDNTVWGGVVGDDGIEGIALGQGTPAGEAFSAVQNMALGLRARGVVLAVCSKNEDSVARTPFRNHPDMLLKEEHIAVFQANWTDKPTNLKAIAKTLNIGTDALVFVDDNPAERAIVRREMPEVAVPELPDEAAYYPRVVLGAGYFESVGFSEEDRQRAEQYRANAKRAALQEGSTDIEGYLRSLGMTARIAPFDATGRARVAQLINKSNQFNLTTRRYTEAEVAALEADPDIFTLQIRLRDTFGDNGMISVIICRPRGDEWEIDTWLMSCRVLGRRVEQMVLNTIAEAARAAGAATLIGRFIPSGRNELVREHYSTLGFEPAGEEENATLWRLDLGAFQPFDVAIAMEDTP